MMRALFFTFILSASAYSTHSRHDAFGHHHFRLFGRQAPSGFALAEKGSLASYKLDSTCEQVLYQTLTCDSYVASLGAPRYHGSLGDNEFTATVCAASCGSSLANIHRRVVGACASTPELFSGYPVVALVDSIWGGWNETCLKDTATGKNCNGVLSHLNLSPIIADLLAQTLSTHGLRLTT